MNFTCNIRKVDFFIDEIEELGTVDLDQAILIFQEFPFEAQLQEAKELEALGCPPTVTFLSSDGKELSIWTVNDEGFSLFYDNGTQISNFYISNNIEKNPDGLLVEEFIELFFNGTIEHELKLADKDEYDVEPLLEAYENNNSAPIVTFQYKGMENIKPYIFTLVYLVGAIIIFILDAQSNFKMGWGFHAIISLFWLPGTYLQYTYWQKNKGATVTINKETKTLKYLSDYENIQFKRTDIKYCKVVECTSIKAPWSGYSYILFKLNNGKQVVITNFITNHSNIINTLKPLVKNEKEIIPFISG